MNRFERDIISDWLANVLWPAFERFYATAAQVDFVMTRAWNVTHDTPVVYVNGVLRTSGTTWLNATTVRISPAAALNDHIGIVIKPGAAAGYLPRNGGQILSDLDANNYRVNNLGAAVLGHQPVRRDQVEALAAAAGDAAYLRRDGTNWPPTADLVMDGMTFTGLPAADAPSKPVIKSQLDALDTAIDARIDGVDTTLISLDTRLDAYDAITPLSYVLSSGETQLIDSGTWLVSYTCKGSSSQVVVVVGSPTRTTTSREVITTNGIARIVNGIIVENKSFSLSLKDNDVVTGMPSPGTDYRTFTPVVSDDVHDVLQVTAGPTLNILTPTTPFAYSGSRVFIAKALLWKLQ